METKIDEIADGIYRLSRLSRRSRRQPALPSTSSLFLETNRYCSIPASGGCSLSSAQHSVASFRPNGYTGLPSAIMRLTSAVR